ncbi:ABC transporter substrate-binding protein [Nesterenkonia alba]|uniref:ABC transporter substrate-binding protein n=1 Tax=Nesterenkonia alba TaxID=515814 RepID=UPI0003B69952|nr:ABC transporter substrate-binding protein [Nesterenkonia alba]
MTYLSRRQLLEAAGLGGVALTLTAATEAPDPEDTDPAETEEPPTPAEGALTIGAISTPGSLDPALAVDTETERICRQIFQTLVGIDADTGSVTPLLAREWEVSEDELTYTFRLRRNVTFHDGEDLTADVVVANIQRWGQLDYLYGYGNVARSTPLAFPAVFGGFFGDETCVLEDVEAEGDYTVVLTLSEPVVFLLQALTQPAFAIASTSVLSDADPELVSRSPQGTGPYRLVETEPDEQGLRLEAFEDYWGAAPAVGSVTVRPIARSFDRLRELTRGRIDVYDHITADNLRPLVQAGRIILQRDPFSVLYLGFNLEHPIMGDHEIREAAARAIHRPSLVEDLFLEGTSAAYHFTPPSLGVESEEAPRYEHNMEEAQELLADSGYDGEPLPFYYPMATTRSWLPRPEAVYAAVARNLTEAGFVLQPRPVKWDDGYVDELMADDDRAMHLLGRNGGYRSAHSFLGSLFSVPSREFHYVNDDVVELLAEARAEADDEERTALYAEAATLIAEDLPAVPLAFPISGLALGSRVADYPMSPVLNEPFAEIVPAQET